MKISHILFLIPIVLNGIFTSCTYKAIPSVSVAKVPKEKIINQIEPTKSLYLDISYVKASDIYFLETGMKYTDVLNLLKVGPAEVLMNVSDNCLITTYNVKSNHRIHNKFDSKDMPIISLNNEAPNSNLDYDIKFYPSSSNNNLSYDFNKNATKVYLIFDGESKKLRSYFFESDQSIIDEYNQIINRAIAACENPDKVVDFLYQIAVEKYLKEQKNAALKENKSDKISKKDSFLNFLPSKPVDNNAIQKPLDKEAEYPTQKILSNNSKESGLSKESDIKAENQNIRKQITRTAIIFTLIMCYFIIFL